MTTTSESSFVRRAKESHPVVAAGGAKIAPRFAFGYKTHKHSRTHYKDTLGSIHPAKSNQKQLQK